MFGRRRPAGRHEIPAHAPRSAVVTGAARGIGEAVATELVERGYRVLVTDLDGDAAAATRIGAAGALAHDVTDPAAAHDVTAAARDLAPLGAWIANAGVGFDGTLTALSEARVRALVEVNTLGPAWGARAAIAAFREQAAAGTAHGGEIGVTVSLSGLGPVPGLSVYAASKAGALSLASGLASEVRREGIRVHAICPDGVDTALLRGMEPGGQAQALVRSGTLVTPTQVATGLVGMFGTARVYRTIPAWRGAVLRLTALLPGPALRMEPAMRAVGARKARSLRR
ncbi:short-chain dehydrogenase/reductase SDR [Pseudonocardia sp. Ae168_Ps1]|uniref:SDR family NAD(P)-dependent oxidoreductase n=1 Tax=unclassified Pseudonocardia TaxID=2619320 RepID=UPI00095BD965|nr:MULTISPECIES: SDR family oxidoreductase [unclassified Pseudonocardia]OLL72940.1 short-chain dehydrogenase/reductase SDR [Pseudonocardia sp. Ae150A_Ps1]OLL78916.1 short-chain dehydrogenase/reductase SDR [Pseudonocardia sp. Ae168_Ps1]OLL86946.1 short-chain dehydrogenase/reductase SDR [Pseudonocardia sp. Ae263_Ps1]OLL93009.1 short-chain dehydrogenase/reductase SDR [Pseudonocardia sp. Ae356_Ps1]